MVNEIQYFKNAGTITLQVTRPARKAGLVVEDANGDATQLSGVYVYGFDGLILVIGRSVDMGHKADLVSTAAGDTGSIHGGRPASLSEAGNGYKVQLPGCKETGLDEGDKAPVEPADGVLIIHDGTQRRLVEDLAAMRSEQVSTMD